MDRSRNARSANRQTTAAFSFPPPRWQWRAPLRAPARRSGAAAARFRLADDSSGNAVGESAGRRDRKLAARPERRAGAARAREKKLLRTREERMLWLQVLSAREVPRN